MEPERIAERVWPGRELVLEPLVGGITNQNFKVESTARSRPPHRWQGLGAPRHRSLRRARRLARRLRAWDRARGRRLRRARGLPRHAFHRRTPDPARGDAQAGDGRSRGRGPAAHPRRAPDPRPLRLVSRRRGLRRDRCGARRHGPGRVRVGPRRRPSHRVGPRRAGAGRLPQRLPEPELPRRGRRHPDRRLGVRGHGRPLLRPGQLLHQPRVRRRCERRSPRGLLRRATGRGRAGAPAHALHVRLPRGHVGRRPAGCLRPRRRLRGLGDPALRPDAANGGGGGV